MKKALLFLIVAGLCMSFAAGCANDDTRDDDDEDEKYEDDEDKDKDKDKDKKTKNRT